MTAQEALAQARAIMGRADYDTLPADVRAWCECIIRTYGDDNEPQ